MVRGKSLTIFVDRTAQKSARRQAGYLFDRMKELRRKKRPVKLGGATGRTYLEVYRRLLDLAGKAKFDLGDVEIYFLDEYFGAAPLYYAYTRQHLRAGKPGGFRPENIWVPRGTFFDDRGRIVNSDRLDAILAQTSKKREWQGRAEPGEDGSPPEIFILPTAKHPILKEIRKSNRRYDKLVREEGKGRIALLGLGVEGHIGFVEGGAATADTGVMLTRLSPSTQRANEADFRLVNRDKSPVELEPCRYAITQGIATILSAAEICLAATGPNKAGAVERMLLEAPSPQNPAGFIQTHRNVKVFLDDDALGKLTVEELEERGYRVEGLPRARRRTRRRRPAASRPRRRNPRPRVRQ